MTGVNAEIALSISAELFGAGTSVSYDIVLIGRTIAA